MGTINLLVIIVLYDLKASKPSVQYVDVLFSKLRSLLGIGASSLGVSGFGKSRVG